MFRKERTRSTPLEPTSCSGAFSCVSVHLAMFRYYTKLDAKWVELVQLMKKFVQRNCIRVFHNERTRSTPLDAKLMNWCVLQCLGALWIVSLLHETRCEIGWTVQLMQKFVPRTHIGIFGNERTRSTPLDPKLLFWCVFVVFGCICQCFVTTWNSLQNGLNWCN